MLHDCFGLDLCRGVEEDMGIGGLIGRLAL